MGRFTFALFVCGVAGIGACKCNASDPIIFDEKESGTGDTVSPDPGPAKGVAELLVEWKGPGSGTYMNAASQGTLVLSETDVGYLKATVDPAPGQTFSAYRVVFCDETKAPNALQKNHKILCDSKTNPENCALINGEANLTIYGSDLEIGDDELYRHHTVKINLVPISVQVASDCTFNQFAAAEITLAFTVHKDIEPPSAQILPPPGADDTTLELCHNRAHALRAKILAAPEYPSGTYCVQWFRVGSGSSPGTPLGQKCTLIVAVNGKVCDDSGSAPAGCTLFTGELDQPNFKKGDTIYVTVDLWDDSIGTQGTTTGIRSQSSGVVICNAWPICTPPTLTADPGGMGSQWTCTTSCGADADGDGIQVKMEFINLSNNTTTETLAPSNYKVLIESEMFSAKVNEQTDGLTTVKDNKVICRIRPDDGELPTEGKLPDTYPYTDDKEQAEDDGDDGWLYNRSEEKKVTNTPPTGSVWVTPEDSATVETTFQCNFKIEDTDVADEKFSVWYEWGKISAGNNDYQAVNINKDSGQSISSKWVHTKQNPFDFQLTFYTPITDKDGPKKGDQLCCRVWAAEHGGAPQVFDAKTTFGEGCAKIGDAPPQVGGSNPSVSVIKSLKQPPEPECFPTQHAPNLDLVYTTTSLTCKDNVILTDADDDEKHLRYYWYECPDKDSATWTPLGSSLDASTTPNEPNSLKFTKGQNICCGVKACAGPPDKTGDTTCIGNEIKVAWDERIVIADTPPNVVKLPMVLAAITNPTSSRNGDFVCIVNPKPSDCDGDELFEEYFWAVPYDATQNNFAKYTTGSTANFSKKIPKLKCNENIACKVQVTANNVLTKSDTSVAFLPTNGKPTVSDVGLSADGDAAVTSPLKCIGSVDDPDGDALEVTGTWYRKVGDQEVEIQTSMVNVTPTPGNNTGVIFSLANDPQCASKSLTTPKFKKGDQVFCKIEATDKCDSGTGTSQAIVIGNSNTQIEDNCSPVTISTKALQGDDEITCSVVPACVNDCDPGEPVNFKWKYTLYQGQQVVGDSGADPINDKTYTFTSNICDKEILTETATGTFHCIVEAFDEFDSQNSTWSDISGTVTVTESKPQATVTLTPSGPKVGDTVTCQGGGSDNDPTDAKLTVNMTLKGLGGNPSEQAGKNNSVTWDVEKGVGGLTCEVMVEDSCFKPVTASKSVDVVNSPPKFTVVLSPSNPTKASTMTCSATGFLDPDGDLLQSYTFDWKIAKDSTSDFNSINCTSSPSTDPSKSTGTSTLDLSKCYDAAKNKYVVCKVTATDNAGSSATFTSSSIQIQNGPPSISVKLTPKGSLPSKPSLDTGQSDLECLATVTDADSEDLKFYQPTYQWFVDGKKTEGATAKNFDVVNNSVTPCQSVQCTASLSYNEKTLSASASQTVWKGGSLRLQGETSAYVDAKGVDSNKSAPTLGRIELWVSVNTLPGFNDHNTILWGKKATDDDWQWRLQVDYNGVPRLQWKNSNGDSTTLKSETSLSSSDATQPWRYLAISYNQFSVSLHHGPQGEGVTPPANVVQHLFNGGVQQFPFNLERLVFGADTEHEAMDGWIDEVRISEPTNPFNIPKTPPPIFVSTTDEPALALYHFVVDQPTSAADYGPYAAYHVSFGQTSPTVAHHSLANLCESPGVLTCNATGQENCILGPSEVTLKFGKVDGTKPAVNPSDDTYWTTCSAAGAMDLASGPIKNYEFKWYRKQSEGDEPETLVSTKSDVSLAEAEIAALQGCYKVWCEAIPKVGDVTLENKKKMSNKVKACATQVPLYGFDCEDNNPCTTNFDDETECTNPAISDADEKNFCNLVCNNGWISMCAPNNVCSCKDPCANKVAGQCQQAVANNGKCDFINATDGTACTPDAKCNLDPEGQCKSGACILIPGETKDCNDNNPCTDDSCDPKTGDCTHGANASPCNDGSACTTSDVCQGATCAGTAVVCNDNNVCTTDACDPSKGCTYTNNTNTCVDNTVCTENDGCKDGLCTGTKVSCDDNNQCTFDSCDSTKGCTFTNTTYPCNDGNACTSGEQCSNGSCVNGTTLTCNDNNPCTADDCDEKTGCKHDNNAAPCDDSNPCTIGDQCANGTCKGGPMKQCDDNNPCTQNTCDPNKPGGCIYSPETGDVPCDDEDLCTTGDKCLNGICLGSNVNTCDDSNSCTDDWCDGTCQHISNDSATCDDGNPCTKNDNCLQGTCKGTGGECNDGNPCTSDKCLVSGCINTVLANGVPCADGSPCTTNDKCATGKCGGIATNCDDKNLCTTDSCNALDGSCQYDPVADGDHPEPCDDNNGCTQSDACSKGVCKGQPFVPEGCDDGNVCTTETCESLGNNQVDCKHQNNEEPCDDKDFCTKIDQCNNGECVGMDPVVCDSDNNPCTDDVCVTTTGDCASFANIISCNDGNACTTEDKCEVGACKGGVPLNCDDDDVCTTDVCDPKSGCTYTKTAEASNCDDGNPCTKDECDKVKGCIHPTCDTCACADDDACTTNTCGNGECKITANKSCDDNNDCTIDLCNPKSGECAYIPENASNSCNDGDNCTVGDHCENGECKSGQVNSSCFDNDLCTIDDCTEDGKCIDPDDKKNIDSYCCNPGSVQASSQCCQTANNNPCLGVEYHSFKDVPQTARTYCPKTTPTTLTGYFKDICLPTGMADKSEVCWNSGDLATSLRVVNDTDFEKPDVCPAVAPTSQCTPLTTAGLGSATWSVLSFYTSFDGSLFNYVVRPVPPPVDCNMLPLGLSVNETATCTAGSFEIIAPTASYGTKCACKVPPGSSVLAFTLSKEMIKVGIILDVWVSGISPAQTNIYIEPKPALGACPAKPTAACAACKTASSFLQYALAEQADQCVWVVSTGPVPANAAVTVGAYHYSCGQ